MILGKFWDLGALPPPSLNPVYGPGDYLLQNIVRSLNLLAMQQLDALRLLLAA